MVPGTVKTTAEMGFVGALDAAAYGVPCAEPVSQHLGVNALHGTKTLPDTSVMVAHQRSAAPTGSGMAPFGPWICTRKVKLVLAPFFTKLTAMPLDVGTTAGGPGLVVSAGLATQLADVSSLMLKPSNATL